MSDLVAAWRLAVGTLTALPIRPPGHLDQAVARGAMLLAPVATLPLAATPLLGHAAVRWLGMPPLLAAALALAGLALGSRGLHLDGLADTCDGLAASYDRARALEIMRRGDVGPAGVAAVVLALAVQGAALASLLGSWPGAVAAAVAVASGRHTLAWSCRRGLPAARPDGLGAGVAESVPTVAAVVAFVVVAGVGAGLLRWADGTAQSAVFACAAAVFAALLLGARARRRLGGVTGDVLGAGVELGTAAALVAAVLTGTAVGVG